MSCAMGTKLYQNLTAIMFVYLFFAGSFSSFDQPNEGPDGQGEYPYVYDFPPPRGTLQPPNANQDASLNPPPALADIGSGSFFSPENFQSSPPPPPSWRKSSKLKPPPPDNRSTTDEWVSSNKRELNLGKKVGLAFLAVAVVLQIVFGGFLMYKRRKIANL